MRLELLKNYEKELHFQNFVFQEDDASVHKAKIVNNFFEEEEREVLEWWANSSDLNVIENLRAFVKRELQKPREMRKSWKKNGQNLDSDVRIKLSENFINWLPYNRKTKSVTSRY